MQLQHSSCLHFINFEETNILRRRCKGHLIWELLQHDPNTNHQLSVLMFTNPVFMGSVSKIKLDEKAVEIKSSIGYTYHH